jgi:hypothetical protein
MINAELAELAEKPFSFSAGSAVSALIVVLPHGDAKCRGVDTDPHLLPTVDRFPIDMKEQRLIRFDRGAANVAD